MFPILEILMLLTRTFLVLVTNLTIPAAVSAADEPTLAQRLERLEQKLEEARVDAHIPGMSIAVVKDDEVVLARGFGLADVEAGRAADEDTLYAIGSTTKAFTATLVGMLVDDGKASWDDEATEYLPYFDLAVRSEDEDAACTLRDLLSHRHGFSRMGVLWLSDQVTRDEILRAAANAEPFDDFRAGFHYCNVTYLAAGVAAGVAGGSTWDELMMTRLLRPLGMRSSFLTTAAAQEDPRLALGYEWVEADSEWARKKQIELERVGPAGSVISNVTDMAQWVRLQLGRGAVGDRRLISAEQLAETWSPQITIAGENAYGLGWMLHEYKGRKVVEHGGNIDGFSAQVGLMPDEGLGFVLLTNLDVAGLQQAAIPIVFDALLEEWPEEPVAGSERELDYEELAGVYVANFASFRDERFEVQVTDAGLALDIPSQRTFGLKDPDAEGKWVFKLTDQIAVSFNRDDAGKVRSLTIHQSGFHFEAPREGSEGAAREATAGLEKFAGAYVREQGGRRVELSVRDGYLTMEDRGMLLAFEDPGADGHAPLRARAEYGATFRVDAEGAVVSFLFHGEAGDRLFTRVREEAEAGADGELPTVEELLELRKSDTRAARFAGPARITGKVRAPQAGISGTVTIRWRDSDCYSHAMDFGKFGRIVSVGNGDRAWSFNTMRGWRDLKGDERVQAMLEHPVAVEGDWREAFDQVEVVRRDKHGDRAVYVVRLTKGELPSRTYWVDAENGDVLRVRMIAMEGSVRIPVTVEREAFEEVDGLRYPRRVTFENPASGRTVMEFEALESGVELADELFEAGEALEK